ncbi:MAG: RcnB family protein [Sphingorhabdus sp.]
MKKLAFSGLATVALVALAPPVSANDSFQGNVSGASEKPSGAVLNGTRGGHRPVVGTGHGPRPHMGGHRWGHRMNGRWFAGFYAPGGWGGYRTPFRGYILPSYWVNPTYSIGNYRAYGLYAPQPGYGWSRYYDDAVLRDGHGYVQDYRSGVEWDRYEGGYAPDGGFDRPEYGPAIGADRGVYNFEGQAAPTYSGEDGGRYTYDGDWTEGRYVERDGRVFEGQWEGRVTRNGEAGYAPAGAPYAPPAAGSVPYQGYATPRGYEDYERCLRNRGVAGGAIGAIIGGVAGNRIAGRGNRTIGTIIGGAAGALAGAGIEKSMNKCKKYLPRDEYAYARGDYPARAPAYPPQGYYPQGYYYYPQPAVTTITIEPAVTTTTTVTEEVYYETVPVKRKAVRKWKPKPQAKPRCVCR